MKPPGDEVDMRHRTRGHGLNWLRQTIAARVDIRLLVGFGAVMGAILGFGHIVEEMLEGDTDAFDRAVLLALRNRADPTHPIGPPWAADMVRDVTALGSFSVLGLIWLSLASYLLLVRRWGLATWITASIVGGSILNSLLKFGFDRPRQDIVPATAPVFTTSFPSGHAMEAAVVYLTVGVLLADLHGSRALKVFFLGVAMTLVIAVGVSRVYLGLHYPTDVLAGWCVGAAWAALCWSIALWLRRETPSRRPNTPV